jgi:2-methylisocitrate lyase-like PEP mutase family enzyme
VLFVESPLDDEQLRIVGETLGSRVPLLANMVEGGKTPLHSIDELAAFGFRLAIFPGAMVRVLSRAAQTYLDALRRDGTTANILDRMNDFQAINDIVGTADMLNNGKQYS